MSETYAEYVWPAWVVSATALSVLVALSLRAYRQHVRRLAEL
ncbi:MAG: heme exporter protein CcmD, partial [Pseudomonadota bacterium]